MPHAASSLRTVRKRRALLLLEVERGKVGGVNRKAEMRGLLQLVAHLAFLHEGVAALRVLGLEQHDVAHHHRLLAVGQRLERQVDREVVDPRLHGAGVEQRGVLRQARSDAAST